MSGSSRSAGAADTEALGAALAERLAPGDVVLVSGDLGAGKTTFVRGACRALGVDGPVTSPTFTIGSRYEGGRVPVSHLDLYRLADLAHEDPSLLDDYVDDEHVAFVEWPAVAEPWFAGRVRFRVTLEHAGPNARNVMITGT
jgi:tRNA threonylcarbamoyladenosine biosynthesis protein TsaE